MRIVHTCLRYPPATGGVETYVQELVERTRNLDEQRDVRVLTSKMRTHAPITELDPNLLLDNPLYVQRLHHAATPGVAYPRLQALSYYLGHHKPDILHGHSFWYQTADTAAKYARKHNIPFILNPYYYENEIRHKPLWQLYKNTIGKRTMATAAAVVVISPFEQELITKAGFSVKRFVLAPPGVDTEQLQNTRENPFQQRNITGTIILAVGRIAPGKGLEDLIATLPEIKKEIPDVHLVLIGEDFGAQAALTQQAQNLGVTTAVSWLGKVSRDELIGAYQHATLLIHPSHYEAFGIVPAEALAAGTPVIARNDTALPYVVPHQKAGLLFASRTELIASTTTLLKNKNQRDQFAAAGKKYITENFTWENTIRKIIDLYNEFK